MVSSLKIIVMPVGDDWIWTGWICRILGIYTKAGGGTNPGFISFNMQQTGKITPHHAHK